jgi:hypothetical protein
MRKKIQIYDGRRFFPTDAKIPEKRFISLDTEDDTRGKVLLTTIYDGETGKAFRTQEKALEFLYNLGPKKPLHAIAHNLEYDLVNLFQGRLEALDWVFFGGKLISAKANNTRLVFWDSLNHSYHSPLSRLGETLGMPKLESSYGWTKGRKLTAKDVEYAMRDTEIVWHYMELMREVYAKIGAEMKATTPATAMDYWRRNFLEDAIPSIAEPAKRFFRQGYYGGRVEVFRMGKVTGRINYYDVNSLYPTVMQGKYPDISRLRMNGAHGMIEATVTIPTMMYPPLPCRLPNGKLVFPCGKVRGTWCTNELDYAKSLGVTVRKVHRKIGTSRLVEPFKAYVTKCYGERLKAKTKLENTMWKLLLNSLYGKFGTSGNVQVLIDPKKADYSKLTGDEFFIGPLLLVDKPTESPAYANVLWAAWTTAAARIVLHKGIRKVANHGWEPVYCDTDSIVVAARKGTKGAPLDVGPALGKWKLEAKAVAFEAKGPKLYQYRTKTGQVFKAKGVPQTRAAEILATGMAEYRKPLRLREASVRGMQPNVWVQAKKSLQSTYDKRIILPDGRTSPLVFSTKGGPS